MATGFMASPWCGDRERLAALVAAWGLRGPSRRSGVSAAKERARHAGRPGGQDVSQRAKKSSAGAAGTRPPAAGKDLWPAEASAARGRLRDPTKRRKLTKPERDKPQYQASTAAAPPIRSRARREKA
jgi:hypothetical protein